MLGAAAVRPLLGSPGVPCPLRTLTGVPCPLCGMTTSVTATVHGHLNAALAANPGGILVVLVAIVLLTRPRWKTVSVPTWSLPAVFLALWVFELFRYSIV
jgi:hypothetical protein